MNRSKLITLFIILNVGLVIARIHTHNRYMQYSYKKQRHELTKEQLIRTKQELTQQFLALKNRDAIKEFAQNELHLHPIKLNQIQRLPA